MEERVLTVPLDVRNVARGKRAGRAVGEFKKHLARHMKADLEQVYVDPEVNEFIWARGRGEAPSKVRVDVRKFDDGVVEATLMGE